MWFCFSKDFLYLDWGNRVDAVVYTPWHLTLPFLSFCPKCRVLGREFSKIDKILASQVRYLAINDSPEYATEEGGPSVSRFIAQDVLSLFPQVEVLVLADRLHDTHESAEELIWLRGDLGNEIVEDSRCMEQDTTFLTESTLWRDHKEYNLLDDIDLTTLGQELFDSNDQIAMPTIIKKSIITSRLKESLMGIF